MASFKWSYIITFSFAQLLSGEPIPGSFGIIWVHLHHLHPLLCFLQSKAQIYDYIATDTDTNTNTCNESTYIRFLRFIKVIKGMDDSWRVCGASPLELHKLNWYSGGEKIYFYHPLSWNQRMKVVLMYLHLFHDTVLSTRRLLLVGYILFQIDKCGFCCQIWLQFHCKDLFSVI